MSDDSISIRDYFDLAIQRVEDQISALKEFEAQHFQLNELAIRKAEESMTNRLEGMNEFRLQLKDERTNLITKDVCEKVRDGQVVESERLETRLKVLERANAFSSGRLWMVMAFFAAIPTILALVALFRK